MIKSLRLRIQLWHALILTLVLVALGVALGVQIRRAVLDEIDAGLLAEARILEGTLRAVPHEDFERQMQAYPLNLSPPRLAPPFAEGRPPERPGPGGPPGAGGPPGPGGPMGPPGARRRGAPQDRRDDRPRQPAPYFAIFASDGVLLREGGEYQTGVTWGETVAPLEFRGLDGRREVLLRGPVETLIVVGRDVRPQLDRLRATLTRLGVLGFGIWGLGLVGGWWLAGKAIEPIGRISGTASHITAANLGERVDPGTMDQELRSLSQTLNSMLDRLQDSFEKQTRFTADASHELRTPLAVILTHCELALSRPRTAEELKQTVGVCQRAAERMRRLVEGLLTLAKSDAGDEEDQRQRTDLRGVADEALTMLEPIARQSGIELRVEGEGAEAFVDPSKLSQAVLNLVHNAILYNRPGGGVVVKVWDEGQRACLSVTDTGIGIPAESLPRLFDRFYRVDASRSQTPGSGLGLAISKSHIESHGGTLDVTSEVGRGSVFTITLPRLVTTI